MDRRLRFTDLPMDVPLFQSYGIRLRKLIEISRNNGIEPVLLTQPALYGEVTDDITGIDLSKTKNLWQILELYNDVTRNVGRDEDVLVIDLAKKMPKSSLYYYDWNHFTAEGAKKVSEIICFDLDPFLAEKFPKHFKKN